MDVTVTLPPELVPGYLKLLSDQLAASKLQVQALTEEAAQLRSDLSGLRSRHDGPHADSSQVVASMEAELTQLRIEKQESEELKASLDARLIDLREQKAAVETEVRALAEERVLLMREKEKQSAHNEEMKKWKQRTVDQVETQHTVLRNTVEEVQRLKERLALKDAELAVKDAELAELKTELAASKEQAKIKDSVHEKPEEVKPDAQAVPPSLPDSSISTRMPQNQMRSEIRNMTSSGLKAVTGNPAAQMTYLNYKRDVQAKLGFQLVGWPAEFPLQNPSNLTLAQMCILHERLRDGTCHWEPISEVEREALKKRYSSGGTATPASEPQRVEAPKQIGTPPTPASVVDISSMSYKQLRSAAMHHISSALRTATGNPSVAMEYTHYERKIQAYLGFQLVGWPLDLLPMQNISHMGNDYAPAMAGLYQRLLNGECRWQAIPAAEHEELKKKYPLPQSRRLTAVDGVEIRAVAVAHVASAPNLRKRKIVAGEAEQPPQPKRLITRKAVSSGALVRAKR